MSPQPPTNLAEFLASLTQLDMAPANSTNGTNSTTPEVPGGFDGYVPTRFLLITAAGIIGAIAFAAFAFWCYRRRALKKIIEAGNVQISVSRGGK